MTGFLNSISSEVMASPYRRINTVAEERSQVHHSGPQRKPHRNSNCKQRLCRSVRKRSSTALHHRRYTFQPGIPTKYWSPPIKFSSIAVPVDPCEGLLRFYSLTLIVVGGIA